MGTLMQKDSERVKMPAMKLKYLTFTMIYLMSACATNPPADYNTAGATGSLISQELGVGSNICRYDTGLTIFTQSNCPPQVRASVYTR